MTVPSTSVLSYSDTGAPGRPVVLLHGLGASRQQPLDLVDRRDGLRFVTPDLRSHGASELPEDASLLTFDQLAADVEDLLDHLGLRGFPLTLLGISMGAAVALQLLHRAELTVRSALLLRPAWGWAPSPDNLVVFEDIAELLRRLPPADGKAALKQRPHYAAIAEVSDGAAAALLAQFDDAYAVRRAHRLSAIPRSHPGEPANTVGATPVTIVGCPADPVHPLQLAEDLAKDLNARFVLVPARYDDPAAHRVGANAAFQALISDT